MAALEDNGEEAKHLVLDSSFRGQYVSIGGTDMLEARGPAMLAFGSYVVAVSLLLIHQRNMDTQSSPSGNTCIQASNLSHTQLHSGPIMGGGVKKGANQAAGDCQGDWWP
jgi:hypothetical protein